MITLKGPAAVVVRAPLNAKFTPVSAMPPTAFVFKAPKVLVPSPVCCVIVEAKIAWVEIVVPLVKIKLVR